MATIENSMWAAVSLSDSSEEWLIKNWFTACSYEVVISNLEITLKETLTDSQIISRMTDLNPNLDASFATVLAHLKSSLLPKGGHLNTLKLEREESCFVLKLCNKFLNKFPFKWSFRFDLKSLAEQDTTRLFLSHPLLLALNRLLLENKNLKETLAEKDREIKDYKEHGAKASRKFLETDPYNEDQFKARLLHSPGYQSSMKLSYFSMLLNKDTQKVLSQPQVEASASSSVSNPPVRLTKQRRSRKPLRKSCVLLKDSTDEDQSDDGDCSSKKVKLSEDFKASKRCKLEALKKGNKGIKGKRKNLLL